MASTLGLLILGLVILLAGGELLVRAASRLALLLGLSPLIIGLTVVSFGTSSPELVVSLQSAWSGQPDIALGNVVGSNIANILCILGLSALIAPLPCAPSLLSRDVPLMILTSLLLVALSANGSIERIEGLFLFACLVAQTIFAVRGERIPPAELLSGTGLNPKRTSAVFWLCAVIIAGLVLLSFGADMFTEAASQMARMFGVSELTIALTVVALGTSLPELVTSGIAAFRGHSDIALGNVVGSNIFNILSVLGLSALLTPVDVSQVARDFDIPVMLLVALILLPLLRSRLRLSRIEGAVLLIGYLVYIRHLLMAGS